MLVAVGLIVLLVSGVVGVLVSMLKCEPAFYTDAACPNDYDTREKASRVLTRIQDLKTDIRTKGEWGETFSAEELNCFFAETMTANGSFASLLPEGFSAPRVAVEGDHLKLGFRYGEGFWSAIVWIELRVWLVAEDINVMAVEVCDLRAGRLAVGTQSVLDAIAEAARGSNIDVTWYRHNGNAVGLFRFFPDQVQPASNVLTLETREGKVVVAGRTRTDLPLPSTVIGP
ncbi:MAG: hypothetical protein C0467_17460 [Planctomycetaceae bacterium]|nr:hypothetical protein [Planctomycetaceae bacterium]